MREQGITLVEITPNSEEYVYLNKGKPLEGHNPSFTKGLSRDPSTVVSEPRDHIIEFPENTEVSIARNLWKGREYIPATPERITEALKNDTHLVLTNPPLKFDPKTMKIYKLVDDKNQLF